MSEGDKSTKWQEFRDIIQADVDTRLVALMLVAVLAGVAIYEVGEEQVQSIFTHAVAAISGLGMGKALQK